MTGPLFFGLLAGVGVWIVLRAFAAPRRSLSRDLDALQQPNRGHEITVDMETRLARSAAGHFGDLLGADALRGDLELVGRTEEQHLVQRLRTALFYGGAPVVLWWLGVIAGVRVAPGAVAHAVGLAGLGAGWLVTDQQLRKRATETREQFGAKLGSFQALQHRMVDMVMELEQARSAVMLAANTFEADRLTREINISAAKNLVGRAGRLIAEEAIQMHGGVGVSWEYALPHYAKRIVMIDHLFGDTDHHLQRYAELTREAG